MGDWRQTLFVWKGTIKARGASGQPSGQPSSVSDLGVIWEGSWLPLAEGQSAAELTDEAFDESPNKFEMIGTCASSEDSSTWTWRGSYLLDQGDGNGHQRFEDIEHRCRLYERGSNAVSSFESRCQSYCVGWGLTEFGSFTSGGWLNEKSLTIARRYLPDKDPRRGPREAHHVDATLIWEDAPSTGPTGSKFLEVGLPFRNPAKVSAKSGKLAAGKASRSSKLKARQ
jgi:hypothetical protein